MLYILELPYIQRKRAHHHVRHWGRVNYVNNGENGWAWMRKRERGNMNNRVVPLLLQHRATTQPQTNGCCMSSEQHRACVTQYGWFTFHIRR